MNELGLTERQANEKSVVMWLLLRRNPRWKKSDALLGMGVDVSPVHQCFLCEYYGYQYGRGYCNKVNCPLHNCEIPGQPYHMWKRAVGEDADKVVGAQGIIDRCMGRLEVITTMEGNFDSILASEQSTLIATMAMWSSEIMKGDRDKDKDGRHVQYMRTLLPSYLSDDVRSDCFLCQYYGGNLDGCGRCPLVLGGKSCYHMDHPFKVWLKGDSKDSNSFPALVISRCEERLVVCFGSVELVAMETVVIAKREPIVQPMVEEATTTYEDMAGRFAGLQGQFKPRKETNFKDREEMLATMPKHFKSKMVDLVLTEMEASILYHILQSVGGHPNPGHPRCEVDNIGLKLKELGVRRPMYKLEGSIYINKMG